MTQPVIQARHLTIGYAPGKALMKDLNFEINQGDIFMIMGGSGCGKSTLLRTMIGLIAPLSGDLAIEGISVWPPKEEILARKFGVLYQSGALFSSMTLAENVALPLQLYTSYRPEQIKKIVAQKLEQVSLGGYEGFYPAQLSGGMKKRAGLARALALDPEIVFFDEPSAGLDPVMAKNLDDLILHINQTLHTTIVIVSHDLDSIFAIGQKALFLDREKQTMGGLGAPKDLLKTTKNQALKAFLTRGGQYGQRTK